MNSAGLTGLENKFSDLLPVGIAHKGSYYKDPENTPVPNDGPHVGDGVADDEHHVEEE